MDEFVADKWQDILFRSYQHLSLVVQSVLLATIIAILLAVLVTRVPALKSTANMISAIGLTIPSFALLGLLLPLVGIGTLPSVIAVAFYSSSRRRGWAWGRRPASCGCSSPSPGR